MPPSVSSLVTDSVITRPLAERMPKAQPDERIGVVIEVRTDAGLSAADAMAHLTAMLKIVAPEAPTRFTRSYLMASLTVAEILELVAEDTKTANNTRTVENTKTVDNTETADDASFADDTKTAEDIKSVDDRGPSVVSSASRHDHRTAPRRYISRIWPNFETQAFIYRSVMTVKADAAVRAFEATGEGIVWAVLDTGVSNEHPHFRDYQTTELPGRLAHRSFVPGSPDPLSDANGHGTHVAGIIAGGRTGTDEEPIIALTWYLTAEGDAAGVERVQLPRISGMAPETKILSCTVLRSDRTGDVAALLEALEYIQDLNQGGRALSVHGVNLSLGYPFDPAWFGTGLSPVCREVNRLVSSGVCVVVAAGNTGYGAARDRANRELGLPFGMTINDPGNAERAITVGATSVKPYSTGVSFFSSKGPTGDGRLKPDLVAPGERILSAGCGQMLHRAAQADVHDATYVEDSGTSMAAPHVSGVAASFLSVHREFIGRPDEVKRILMDSAGDLGRERTFQGSGLVDAMRAIQSV